MPFLMAAVALALASLELGVSSRSTVYASFPGGQTAAPGTAGVTGLPGVGPGVVAPGAVGVVPGLSGVVAVGAGVLAVGAAAGGGAAPWVVVVVCTGVLSCPPEESPIAAPTPAPIASTEAAATPAISRQLGGRR